MTDRLILIIEANKSNLFMSNVTIDLYFIIYVFLRNKNYLCGNSWKIAKFTKIYKIAEKRKNFEIKTVKCINKYKFYVNYEKHRLFNFVRNIMRKKTQNVSSNHYTYEISSKV
ncbi:hypothetical protein DMUE_4025 [Dictyocoela muelleri]|nr:hypothetical protein DMUE_4025 [Dictyocoela muelleri]